MRTFSPLAFAGLVLAGCAAAPTTCGLAKVGDFPVTMMQGNPVVTIQLAGHDERMVLDTGADGSILTPHAYNALNLDNAVSTNGFYAEGAGGTMQMNSAIVEDLTVGKIAVKNEDMMVANFENFDAGHGAVPDGLLGNDVLQDFDVALDLPNHLVSLYLPQGCATSSTPWIGDYAVVPFVRLPSGLNTPVIQIQIDNQNFTMLIDSGAFSSFVTQNALEAAGVTAEANPAQPLRKGYGIGGNPFGYRKEQFSSVAIGAEVISNGWLLIGSSGIGSDRIDGVLGRTYLAHHRVFLANDTHTAYLGVTLP